MDTIKITILGDGTIKTDNDSISMPNHENATQFQRALSFLAGGKTEIKLKGLHLHAALHAHTQDGHTHSH